MNLGELKTNIKRQFGDESGVQVTDDDVVRWLEQAQNEIVKENEEILNTRVLIDIVAGQDEYPLPEDLLTVRSLQVKDTSNVNFYSPIPYRSNSQFEHMAATYRGASGSALTPHMYTTYNSIIFLFPVPLGAITDGMRLFYAKQPDMPTVDADTLGLPLSYHNAILKYCLVQAYELDENFEASGYKLAQWQQDLNRQANRAKDEARGTYPTITVNLEDL